MANLSTCKTCDKTVSVEAAVCPHCGQTFPAIAFHCKKCKSKNVTISKRGFSPSLAIVGGVLAGGVGLLAGVLGKQNLISYCRECGFRGDLDGTIRPDRSRDSSGFGLQSSCQQRSANQCPDCGFTYAWNGASCRHCGYPKK